MGHPHNQVAAPERLEARAQQISDKYNPDKIKSSDNLLDELEMDLDEIIGDKGKENNPNSSNDVKKSESADVAKNVGGATSDDTLSALEGLLDGIDSPPHNTQPAPRYSPVFKPDPPITATDGTSMPQNVSGFRSYGGVNPSLSIGDSLVSETSTGGGYTANNSISNNIASSSGAGGQSAFSRGGRDRSHLGAVGGATSQPSVSNNNGGYQSSFGGNSFDNKPADSSSGANNGLVSGDAVDALGEFGIGGTVGSRYTKQARYQPTQPATLSFGSNPAMRQDQPTATGGGNSFGSRSDILQPSGIGSRDAAAAAKANGGYGGGTGGYGSSSSGAGEGTKRFSRLASFGMDMTNQSGSTTRGASNGDSDGYGLGSFGAR